MKTIRFLDLRPHGQLRIDLDSAYRRVMDSGKYILSDEVKILEDEFSLYQGGGIHGLYYSAAVGNGFDALRLSIMALSKEKYPEEKYIGVPINAPIPVWMAVSSCMAIPYPIMVDYSTLNTSTDLVNDAIKELRAQKKEMFAVIAVHLYGNPIRDIDDLSRLLFANEIFLIEDCSQAHGARIRNLVEKCDINVGSFADFSVYSFYPTKNCGGYGDGGIVVSQNSYDIEKIKSMRFYGEGKMLGVNSRMDEMQAAFIRKRLVHLDYQNEIRVTNARTYRELLRVCDSISLPPDAYYSVYHQFVIRSRNRDELRKYLSDNGVETMIHYPEIPPVMPYYRQMFAGRFELENEILGGEVLSLPVGIHIGHSDVEYVCSLIRSFECES